MDIRTIEYRWNDDMSHHIGDVVVGDGTIIYDADYDEYDDRIFFYFQDEEEFQLAFFEGGLVGTEFTIVKVL